MFHVKHFGKFDDLRKRTIATRGMVRSRDLAQAKLCDRVRAWVLPGQTIIAIRPGRDLLQLHPMRTGERFDGGASLGFDAAHRNEKALVIAE
jgi:hypothetical protein